VSNLTKKLRCYYNGNCTAKEACEKRVEAYNKHQAELAAFNAKLEETGECDYSLFADENPETTKASESDSEPVPTQPPSSSPVLSPSQSKRIIDYEPIPIMDASSLPVYVPVEGSYEFIEDGEGDYSSLVGRAPGTGSAQATEGYDPLFDDDANAGIEMFGDRYTQSMSRLHQTQQSLALSLPSMPSLPSLSRPPRPQALRDLPMKLPPSSRPSSVADGPSLGGDSNRSAEYQSAHSSPGVTSSLTALAPNGVIPTPSTGAAAFITPTDNPPLPITPIASVVVTPNHAPPVIPLVPTPAGPVPVTAIDIDRTLQPITPPIILPVPTIPNHPPLVIPTTTPPTECTHSAIPSVVDPTFICSTPSFYPFATPLDNSNSSSTDLKGENDKGEKDKAESQSAGKKKKGGKKGSTKPARGGKQTRAPAGDKENTPAIKVAGKRKRADEVEVAEQPPAKALRRSIRDIKFPTRYIAQD
jgi:hypothetical protein